MTIKKSITPKELKTKLDSGEKLMLIDVREQRERDLCTIGGELIPSGTIEQQAGRIPKDIPVVIYCRGGGRSGAAIDLLQKKFGFTNLINLDGGILRWSDDVDPTIKKY